MRLDGYIRISRVGGREGEGYISPAVQREAITSYAKELGGEIVAWHEDQDQSGGNIDRPGFQAVLERLRAGETDGVVVFKIDRFARSVADGSTIAREIVDRGQIFASCVERIDPSTDVGKYQLHDFLNNGELFLNQIKTGWRTAKARAIARGAHIGPTPIGYQRIPKGQEKGGCLEVDSPTYGPAMSRLFKRAASGEHRDSNLAKWFTEVAPRETRMAWQASEIRRWLSNRVYLGEVHYGDLVNVEAHEPLTDPETWESCQRESGDRRKTPSRFLLSGLVRCASCRYSMGGQWNAGADQNTPVYRCPCGASRGCKEPSLIVASRIEDYILGAAKKHVADLKLTASAETPDLARLDQELAWAEQEVHDHTSDLSARRVLGADEWQKMLQQRVADRDSKRRLRDEVAAKQQLADLSLTVEDLSRQDLRDLLSGMIRHVFIRRNGRGSPASERALIVWADDRSEIDVPGPHRSGPYDPIRW